MKKRLILLCFGLLVSIAGYSPQHKTLTIAIEPPIRPFKALLEATGYVESSNDPNALNTQEMAYGKYQIRKIRIVDYNRRTGKRYTLKDCYNEEISKEIYLFYAMQFHPSDLEQIARKWNGSGPMTREYWGKIKKQMDAVSKNN